MSISINTPREWWNKLNEQVGFTIDVAATDNNHLCEQYYTQEQDALAEHNRWTGRVWCAPPWDEPELHRWVDKAYWEWNNKHADFVAMLLPVRIEASWWDYLAYAKDVYPLNLPYDIPEGYEIEEHMMVIFGELT
jgi:site-specific DNA-methyltransferase (adenine-specific)